MESIKKEGGGETGGKKREKKGKDYEWNKEDSLPVSSITFALTVSFKWKALFTTTSLMLSFVVPLNGMNEERE